MHSTNWVSLLRKGIKILDIHKHWRGVKYDVICFVKVFSSLKICVIIIALGRLHPVSSHLEINHGEHFKIVFLTQGSSVYFGFYLWELVCVPTNNEDFIKDWSIQPMWYLHSGMSVKVERTLWIFDQICERSIWCLLQFLRRSYQLKRSYVAISA